MDNKEVIPGIVDEDAMNIMRHLPYYVPIKLLS